MDLGAAHAAPAADSGSPAAYALSAGLLRPDRNGWDCIITGRRSFCNAPVNKFLYRHPAYGLLTTQGSPVHYHLSDR